AAAMVIFDGAVLAAWGDIERRFMCHSMRKSVMSALWGVHVDRGDVDISKTLAQLGIDDMEPALTEIEKRATILDLLKARSGVYRLAAYEPPQNPKPPRHSHEPGTFWCYNNWDFNTLCTIIEQEAGIKVFEDFRKHFAQPLEMQDYRVRDGIYMYERDKSTHPAYHIRMSARDLARFGLLYLRDGQWKDERILSQDWIRESTKSHSDAWGDEGYGYLWWISKRAPFSDYGMYSALGVGVQSLDVLPGADLVFVHRVNTYDNEEVSEDERLELLRMILEARTLEPASNPKVLPLPSVPTPEELSPVELSPDLKKKLASAPTEPSAGRLILDGETLVYQIDMEEEVLVPVKNDRFFLEDSRHEIIIEKNDDGSLKRILSEAGLNHKGFELLGSGNGDQAIEMFELAVKYYPHSTNALDSLAEGYAANGNLKAAQACFKKILKMDQGNTRATWMLDELKYRMNPVKISMETLKQYAGDYETVRILLQEDRLYLVRKEDSLQVPLIPISKNTFLGQGIGYPRFLFKTDQAGSVEGIQLIFEDHRSDLIKKVD
ncbi:MAG: serine hydrolase, partial [Planctomycetes bacterium]|nr:serine hydrolase [Planctomycetota bacterium]